MLLHRDDNYLSPRKSKEEDCKEQTHVVALSVTEQVLLMTCKVTVTAANESSTVVRALINSGSSASFVHEQLAQKELQEPVHLQEVPHGSSLTFHGNFIACVSFELPWALTMLYRRCTLSQYIILCEH